METVNELELKQAKLKNYAMLIGTVGTISGWVYANRTGGGFWRYVGFGFAGGVIASIPAYIFINPKLLELKSKIDEKKKV